MARKRSWLRPFKVAAKETLKLSKPKRRSKKRKSGVDYMRRDISRARGRLAVAGKSMRARARAYKIRHFEPKRESIYDKYK